MSSPEIESKLISALTQLDAREQIRTGGTRAKGYNPNALGIYFYRVEQIIADIDAGADVRAAICAGFTGRPLNVCLQALNLPSATVNERLGRGRSLFYHPIVKQP
jgi:hypothetical protein